MFCITWLFQVLYKVETLFPVTKMSVQPQLNILCTDFVNNWLQKTHQQTEENVMSVELLKNENGLYSLLTEKVLLMIYLSFNRFSVNNIVPSLEAHDAEALSYWNAPSAF